jgi:hypothetical protein
MSQRVYCEKDRCNFKKFEIGRNRGNIGACAVTPSTLHRPLTLGKDAPYAPRDGPDDPCNETTRPLDETEFLPLVLTPKPRYRHRCSDRSINARLAEDPPGSHETMMGLVEDHRRPDKTRTSSRSSCQELVISRLSVSK